MNETRNSHSGLTSGLRWLSALPGLLLGLIIVVAMLSSATLSMRHGGSASGTASLMMRGVVGLIVLIVSIGTGLGHRIARLASNAIWLFALVLSVIWLSNISSTDVALGYAREYRQLSLSILLTSIVTLVLLNLGKRRS